uniref:hypothetical protein n=1 Tax=Oceanospirillum sanctuarii TaxID=1434821 RepID=UPI0015937648
AGNTSQIEGVYAFGDRQLDNYLAGMTTLIGINGVMVNDSTGYFLSDFTLYQNENGLLTAVVNQASGEQWVVADTGGESTGTLGDAKVIWGSWNNWHQIQGQMLSEQLYRTQYIYTDILTDTAIPAALQGIYNFNTVYGIVQDDTGNTSMNLNGSLSIDFTQQNASMDLSGSLGSDSWGAFGTGSLSNLYAGSFALSGSRYDGVVTDALSGTVLGEFGGSYADGLFGYFHLTGTSSQIEGVYAFGFRQLDDYLSGLSSLSGVNGSLLNRGNSYSLDEFSLYQDNVGLAAVFYPVTAEQWVAASTASSEAFLGDATVNWGTWTTWRQINDQSLIEQSTPIQYIYTDQLTDPTTIFSHENIFMLTSVGGSASNQAGEVTQSISSTMTIDFIDQDVDLLMDLSFSGSQWSMSGSGQISDFIGSGLGLIGERYDSTDRLYESSDGVFFGDFVGSSVDGIAGYYQLNSVDDYADGSLVLTKDMLLNEKRIVTGNHLTYFNDTQAGFYSTSALGAEVTTLDGNLMRFSQGGSISEVQSSDLLFGATSASAANQINWGYWGGYIVDDGLNGEQYFDQQRYFAMIDSSALHTLASSGRPNMQVKFGLLGAAGHDQNGNQLIFDEANSYLMLDFNASVMTGQFEMASGTADTAHDKWTLYTDYYLLSDVANGEGNVLLFGGVTSFDIQGGETGYASVEGYWDFVWTGDRSDILMGGFSAQELSDIGIINYSSSGLLVFSDSTAQNSVVDGTEFSGLVSGFGSQLGWGVGFSFDPEALDSLSGYYVSEADSQQLVGAFNDNQGISVDSSSAQFISDTSSYEIINDSYSSQLDGTYSVSGTNSIRGADGSEVAKVQWGRWGSSNSGDILMSNGEGVDQLDVLHFITADNLTSAAELASLASSQQTATFSFAGGTLPTLTTVDGITTGTVNNLSLNVDFGGGSVNSDMSLGFNGANIAAFGSGTLDQFLSYGISLDAYQVETLIGTGSLQGQFVGPNADGALVGYELNTDLGVINGAGTLQKTTETYLQAP